MKKLTFTKYDVQAFLEDKLSNGTATVQEETYYIDLQMNDKLTYGKVFNQIITQMDYFYND